MVGPHSFELQVLHDLSQQVGTTRNYDDLLHVMLEHLFHAVPYDVSASILMVEDPGTLYIRLTRRLSPEIREDIEAQLLQSFVRMSGRATPLKLEDLQIHPLASDVVDTRGPMISRLGSTFQVPFIVGQEREVVGLLFVGAEQVDAFSEDHIRLFHTVANQASLGMQLVRALRADAQQQRLQSLIENLPEGVLMLDEALHVMLANPVAQAYLAGLTDTDIGEPLIRLGGTPIEDLMRPLPQDMYHEVDMDGPRHRKFEVNVRPVSSRTDAAGWVLIIREVTSVRQAQARLQQQARLEAVGQLAAGVAHGFNNLLTGIIGYAELLQMRTDVPVAVRERLERIVEQGERGAHLVRQLMDFTRTAVSAFETLDLAPMLKEAADVLQSALPERCHLVLALDPGAHFVRADPSRLQQALTNLAVNAQEAMPEGGTLTLRLARFTRRLGERSPVADTPLREWIVVSVSDTGLGIPEAIQPYIFEPFFTTKEPGSRTGLGLAQVYGIVAQHEGYVDMESREGKGTTVTMYLPAVEAEEVASRTGEPEEYPCGQGETVLLVEDEPDVLDVGQAILEYLGYRVLTADSGRQALEMYPVYRDEIDLVLMDMGMPEMDGVQVFNALKVLHPEVKVVLMTGYPLGEESQQFLAQGMVDWLQKPLKIPVLAQTLHRALGA